MSEMARWLALAHKDARGIARDGFLLWMAVYPLVLTALLRFALPWIPIEGIHLYAAPAAVILAPSLLGMLLGFSLIEEREQKTWVLLRVLPLPERTLWTYVVGIAFAAGLLLSLVCAAIYGLPPARTGRFLALVSAGALTAPTLALLLAAISRDKIQGLALGKILSASSAAPLLAFFMEPAWQWLLCWSPWYWIYVGLLESLAAPGELAGLVRPVFPPLPEWSHVWVPVGQCTALMAVSMRMIRRRGD